jgi:hypothetical protein
MTTSIIEQLDGTSIVLVTGQDGEHQIFDVMETDNLEDLGPIDYELFHGHAVFNYSLLGAPNADTAEVPDVLDSEDAYL